MKAIESIRLTNSQKRKAGIILLMAVLLAGAAAGTIMICMGSEDIFTSHNSVFRFLIRDYSPKTAVQIFIDSFKSIFIFLIVQFVLGFFAVGQPFEIMTVVIKGAVSGISASLAYLSYGLRGMAVNLVMLIPFAVLSSFILIAGARESFRFSCRLFRCAFSRDSSAGGAETKLYCLRFGVLTLFSAAVSAADSVLTGLFDGLLIP